MAAVVFAVTGAVVTVKLADFDPTGTVTLDGTEAADLLLDTEMTKPPLGASEEISTVPVVVPPPTKVAGLNEKDVSEGASIVNVADFEVDPTAAVILAVLVAATAEVLTAKVPVVFPLPTVTDESTDASAVEELSVTTTPPEGAFLESVTVPTDGDPPATDAGAKDTLDTV